MRIDQFGDKAVVDKNILPYGVIVYMPKVPHFVKVAHKRHRMIGPSQIRIEGEGLNQRRVTVS